ncbi:hypothetical protein SLEP1_g38330 [Rubroshorea leprosula]|nr:hypothetical protein SLEP1_g38330 [Rubroshorea leprosula]
MHPKASLLVKLRFLAFNSQRFLSFSENLVGVNPLLPIAATYSTICHAQVEHAVERGLERPRNPIEVLKRWGCSEKDISVLISRRPSLSNANVTLLQPKLELLKSLGLTASDLVKVVNCRPRFLSLCIKNCFEERLEYFLELFGTRELLCKAIVRNPSLLTYDFHNRVKPIIALYDEMGLTRNDLITMLLSRPTLIPRTSFNREKMEYICKTGISKGTKMYKYVVCLIGISRLETIQEKVANLEKFGISEDEIWKLFGRSPLVLTLSVDKVQRNMTFIVGTLKLPSTVILGYPHLLFCNLELLLRPRALLASKIKEMDLSPQILGPLLFRALRMSEKRFLKAFVTCHEEDLAKELMEFYQNAKGIKRLAQASKKNVHQGFPF